MTGGPGHQPDDCQACAAADVGVMTQVPHTCKHCGNEIEYERLAGWVDRRSGDDGGTYDVCVATWNSETERHGGHKP